MEKLQVDNGHLQAVILQVARETGRDLADLLPTDLAS